jgi:hypothetical protein
VNNRFLHKGIKAFQGNGVSGAGAGAKDKEELTAKKEKNEKDNKNKITTMTKIQVRQASYRLRVIYAYYAVNREFLSRLSPELL